MISGVAPLSAWLSLPVSISLMSVWRSRSEKHDVVEREELAAQLVGQGLVDPFDLGQDRGLLLGGRSPEDLQGGGASIDLAHPPASGDRGVQLTAERLSHLAQHLGRDRLDGRHATQDRRPLFSRKSLHDRQGQGTVDGAENQSHRLRLLAGQHHGERLGVGLREQPEDLVARGQVRCPFEDPARHVGAEALLHHVAHHVLAGGGVSPHPLHGVDEVLEGLGHVLLSGAAQLAGPGGDAAHVGLGETAEELTGQVRPQPEDHGRGALGAVPAFRDM